MEQRSDEWLKIRCGQVGASRIADIMARTKSGPSASRKNYMAELLCARLTGKYPESYESEAMRWGTETEPLARSAYEAITGNMVEEVAWVPHPTIIGAGCSPDGLVGSAGLVEIKCPNTATHIETLTTGEIDMKYQYQMSWQIECTNREWCDFVSYDPRLPDNLAIKIIRFVPAPGFIDAIKEQVIAFLAELDALEAKLKAM
jgi:putative phage-type endonuclease